MKRTAIVTAIATSIVVASCQPAVAGPADRATKELQQEIEDDSYTPPAWMLDPTPTVQEWGYADAIIGITLVVGLVVLW